MTGSGPSTPSDRSVERPGRPGHNELFPSADWRCLLPDPAPATVAVLAGGPLGEFARRLGPRPADSDASAPGAELGVADRVDRATLGRLRAAVRPGGVVYLELAWPRHRPIGRLTGRLARAGLIDPIAYSLSPSDDRWSPSWWIAAGDGDAVRFVAGQVGSRGGNAPSLVNRLRSASTRALLAAPGLAAANPWLLHPTRAQRVCIVARMPGGGDEVSSEPGLLPELPGPFVRRRRAVMRVGGSSTDQAMVFGLGDDEVPEVVVKVPTRSEELVASRHEAGILAGLGARPDPVAGVPRVVPLPTGDRLEAWGQRFAPGRALAAEVDPSNLERHARAMTRWLADLAERRPGPEPLAGADTMLDDLEPLFAGLGDGAEVRRRAEARLGAIHGVPSVLQHRDLGPWNVLVDGPVLRVIDWADATTSGPPLCDLHHFLSHLVLCAFDAYGPDRRWVFVADLADRDSTIGRLVDDGLRSYAGAVGLDPGMLDGLRVVTWLLDLLRRPPGERADSIYLELLLAELGLPVRARRATQTGSRSDGARPGPEVGTRARELLLRLSSWRP